jgi:hypothetical protein
MAGHVHMVLCSPAASRSISTHISVMVLCSLDSRQLPHECGSLLSDSCQLPHGCMMQWIWKVGVIVAMSIYTRVQLKS